MNERKFNLFNWQPFYILVVLLIFSGYIQRNKLIQPINNQNKIITASLTNDFESPNDQNDNQSVDLHSKFSDTNPFDNFPGKESVKDIRLNNVEAFNFNQTDKNLIKTAFRYTGIHELKMCSFIVPPSVQYFTGIETFFVLRV
ncbi:MAG: hypothetical protein PHR81_12470 [Bacteroidales bacterium]|jgi:hypothetical protein|nr:hypothetical protein [Bacteroidales bacterium]MDD4215616.1 hypothetical protein [Bacteroidales bacterium]